jgi:hypothetical protein
MVCSCLRNKNSQFFIWVKNDFGLWFRDKTAVILSGQKFISSDFKTKQSIFYLGIKNDCTVASKQNSHNFFLGKK